MGTIQGGIPKTPRPRPKPQTVVRHGRDLASGAICAFACSSRSGFLFLSRESTTQNPLNSERELVRKTGDEGAERPATSSTTTCSGNSGCCAIGNCDFAPALCETGNASSGLPNLIFNSFLTLSGPGLVAASPKKRGFSFFFEGGRRGHAFSSHRRDSVNKKQTPQTRAGTARRRRPRSLRRAPPLPVHYKLEMVSRTNNAGARPRARSTRALASGRRTERARP